ncbi:hypothetical protein T484DRAFT_1785633, partial [Baffinella frigidus]
MRVLALLALLVALCGAFFHGAAPCWGLALRSLSSPHHAQQPFCSRQLVAAGQDWTSVGAWGAGQAQLLAGQAQLLAGRWRAERCVALRMAAASPPRAAYAPCNPEGRAGVGTGDGDGGGVPPRADFAPAVGRRDSEPTRPGGRGGYRGRVEARQLTVVIKECKEVGELARILQEHRGLLNQIHVSAAWVCLAKIGRGRGGREVGDVLSPLQEMTRDVLDQMGGREIANILHSMAKLRQMDNRGLRADRELLEAMQRRATVTAEEFKPQEVAILLWALATMGGRKDRELVEAMQRRAAATAGEFTPQEIANV